MARGLRRVLFLAAFCRAPLLIFRWFINYLGLWQSWGQGFEPPQLHQKFTRGHGAIRDPARVFGGLQVAGEWCAGLRASGAATTLLVEPIQRRLAVHLDRVVPEPVLRACCGLMPTGNIGLWQPPLLNISHTRPRG